MADFGAFERLKRRFAARFTPEDAGFLFRRNDRTALVRVSADEVEDFTRAFGRTLTFGAWGAFIGGAAIAWWIGDGRVRLPLLPRCAKEPAGVTALVLVFALIVWRAWTAPARALRERIASGPAPTPFEARRAFWTRISYAQLALGVAATGLMLFNAARTTNVLHGGGRLWLAGSALLLALFVVQGVRKWRFERAARPNV